MPRVAAKNDPAKLKPRKKKVNGYKFPEKLPEGEVLQDTAKNQWILGSSIGQGGFGEIYCASALGETGNSKPYVIKIEPHENGPLFVERNFYIKIARPQDVQCWKKENGIHILGIPTFYGSGSHEYKNDKYRFIVLERYGNDLWNLFLNNQRKFPVAAVCKCAIQIIDVLHYIHDKGYVHGDIKGANLLLGLRKGTENNVFLVDFGLACKYNTKEFKPDPKKAHNGTIEYTSRDSHIGVPTRRGDMEILGFNLLHWMGSSLPWESVIKNPQNVYEKKRELMEDVESYMTKHFSSIPKVIVQYLNYVANLKHDELPDYDFCKGIFLKELKSLSESINGKLDFSKDTITVTKSATPKKTPKAKNKSNVNIEKYSTPTNTVAAKRKASMRLDDSDSENDIFLTPLSPQRITRTSVSRNTPSTPVNEKPARKPNAKVKKETDPKPSWKDAPTAQASNIFKAGEYTKKTRSPIKKKKTK